MGSNARRLVVALQGVQPTAFEDHVGYPGRDVPEHVAVCAFTCMKPSKAPNIQHPKILPIPTHNTDTDISV